jgi:hypothetical protein
MVRPSHQGSAKNFPFFLHCKMSMMAQSGHANDAGECPLWKVEQTLLALVPISAEP